MKVRHLTVPIAPVPKERGRIGYTKGQKAYIYTPHSTAAFEKAVKAAWVAEHGKAPLDGPCEVKIVLSADSVYIRVQELEDTPSTLAGDCDNYAKAVLDALNKVAYTDDKKVQMLHVEKL